MYNRYIPQSDGSFQKNRIPDPPRPEPTGGFSGQNVHSPPPQDYIPPQSSGSQSSSFYSHPSAPPNPLGSIGNFLHRLLPSNLDTGDLLIIVLLLLMAGEDSNDQGTALLTLALYLFL